MNSRRIASRRLWLVAVAATLLVVAVVLGRPRLADPSHQPPSPEEMPAVGSDTAWFSLNVDPTSGLAIRVGTLSEGAIATHPAPTVQGGQGGVIRQVASVADGKVAYLVEDGNVSRLMVANARTGESREVIATDDAFVDVQLTRDGAVAYLLLADGTGRALSVIRVETTSGDAQPVQQLMQGRPIESSFPLLLSPNDEVLALVECRFSRCELRATGLSLDDGVYDVADRPQVVAVTDRFAVMAGGRRLDWATGINEPIPGIEGYSLSERVVLDDRGHTLLVRQIAGTIPWGVLPRPQPDRPVLEVADLTDDRLLPSVTPDLAALRIVDSLDTSAGVELPPGWVLVTGIPTNDAEQVSWYAVRVSDGQTASLPALGEFPRP